MSSKKASKKRKIARHSHNHKKSKKKRKKFEILIPIISFSHKKTKAKAKKKHKKKKSKFKLKLPKLTLLPKKHKKKGKPKKAKAHKEPKKKKAKFKLKMPKLHLFRKKAKKKEEKKVKKRTAETKPEKKHRKKFKLHLPKLSFFHKKSAKAKVTPLKAEKKEAKPPVQKKLKPFKLNLKERIKSKVSGIHPKQKLADFKNWFVGQPAVQKIWLQVKIHRIFIFIIGLLLLISYFSLPFEAFGFLALIVVMVLVGLILLKAELRYLIYYMLLLSPLDELSIIMFGAKFRLILLVGFILFYSTIMILAVRYFTKREIGWKLTKLDFIVILFLIAAFASMLFNYPHLSTLDRPFSFGANAPRARGFIQAFRGVYSFILFFLIHRELSTKESLDKCLKIILFLALVLSIFTISNAGIYLAGEGQTLTQYPALKIFTLGSDRVQGLWGAGESGLGFRMRATFTEPSYYAFYLVLIFPLVLAYTLLQKSLKKKSVMLVITSLLMVSLYLTNASTAFLGIAAALAVFFALKFLLGKRVLPSISRMKVLALLLAILVGGAIFLSNPSNQENFDRLMGRGFTHAHNMLLLGQGKVVIDEKDPSISLRRGLDSLAVRAFWHNPITGVGFESFRYVYTEYLVKEDKEWTWHSAHRRKIDEKWPLSANLYLDVLSGTGLIGFIPFVAIILGLFAYLFLGLIKSKDDLTKAALLGFIAGLTGLFTAYLGAPNFFRAYVWLFFGIAFGAALLAFKEEKRFVAPVLEKKNILLITPYFFNWFGGGTEKYILSIGRKLREKNNVTVILPAAARETEKLERLGIKLVKVKRLNSKNPIRMLNSLRTIRRITHKENTDLIMTFSSKMTLYAYLSKFNPRTPIIHALLSGWKGLYHLIFPLILIPADRIICISEAARRRLNVLWLYNIKLKTIYPGINLAKYSPSVPSSKREFKAEGKKVVGTVARLVPQKGISLFLNAASYVLRKAPKTKFVIVGEGPNRKEYEDLAERLGLKKHVLFLGYKENHLPYTKAFDVFAMSSLWEPFGYTLIEAMALKKPVVSTKCDGPKEILTDKVDGLLAETNPQELGEAILFMLKHKDKARKMAAKARKTVEERFSEHKMLSQTTKLLEESLAPVPWRLGLKRHLRAGKDLIYGLLGRRKKKTQP